MVKYIDRTWRTVRVTGSDTSRVFPGYVSVSVGMAEFARSSRRLDVFRFCEWRLCGCSGYTFVGTSSDRSGKRIASPCRTRSARVGSGSSGSCNYDRNSYRGTVSSSRRDRGTLKQKHAGFVF